MHIHNVLTTLIAEVIAIINAKFLVPLLSDAESPIIVTPAVQKLDAASAPEEGFGSEDLYAKQWKHQVSC